MAKNENLHRAKTAKHDEFYTQRTDIENELRHYAAHFAGKVVYCNCDDPATSEFWRFFVRNFRPWGLKKLIATHYEPDEKNYGYVLELSQDTNGDGLVDARDEPLQVPLPCNGDFRSAACIELLQQADIVVTNPPFSLFRDYVAQLMEYEKKFVIIGNMNAITYKEIFPLLKENRMWLGYGFQAGNAFFRVADGMDTSGFAKGVYDPETGCVKFRNCCWFTNLDIPKRHEPLDLRGNYYDPALYPRYDNYDAIEVSKVAEIPCDYAGVMGVPVTFFDSYCPTQFEIVGITKTWYGMASKIYPMQKQIDKSGKISMVSKLNDGPVLLLDSVPEGITYYEVEKQFYKQIYARILIRKRADTK